MAGCSGFLRSLVSFNTSEIRLALAILIATMTNTIDNIIRLIRIFMQYVRRLISSPVVRESLAIIFAPNQLTNRIQVYTAVCIIGALNTRFVSAFTKML